MPTLAHGVLINVITYDTRVEYAMPRIRLIFPVESDGTTIITSCTIVSAYEPKDQQTRRQAGKQVSR